MNIVTVILIGLGIVILIVGFLFFCYILGLREINKGHQKGINKLLKISRKVE